MIRQPIITVLGHVDHGKCVAKGTKVFLANGEIIPIETIFEQALQSGKKLICEDGLCIELEKPLWVLGEENHQIKPMIISHAWKLEKKDLIRIECNNGQVIETTPEHPFPVLNENFGGSYVPCQDISENNYILVPSNTPSTNTTTDALKSVVLEKLAEKNFLVFLEKDCTAQIRQTAQINSHSSQYNALYHNRLRAPNLINLCKNKLLLPEIFDKISSVKQSTSKWRAGHTSKKIRMPKANKEFEGLFYFAGLFFGDGDNYSGKLCNNDKQLLEWYKNYSENVFQVPCVIRKSHTCLEAFPKGGKTLTTFLQAVFEIPKGKKSGKIKVPKILQVASSPLVASFIQGYFDTDGYVDRNNGIEISSNSKRMLIGLSYLLLRFGVRCFIRKNKNAFRLTIKGKTNVQNFAAQIGFRLKEKRESLGKYLKIVQTSRVLEETPIKGKQLRTLRQEFGIGNKRLKIPYLEKTENYQKVSMNFLTQFVQRMKNAAEHLPSNPNPESSVRLHNLIKITQGNLAFSKIVKKEYIKNDYGFVFDLTQPKTHNFVANSFLVHNTTFLDKIRGTAVAAREAGAITQHIGATEVPIEVIKELASDIIEKYKFKIELSGLLFIDTPGHEAFTNLRKRGGSIADLAVLVIDVNQGIQPQTMEAIDILKMFKVPFIVLLNKIDKMPGWVLSYGSITNGLKLQSEDVLQELDKRLYEIVGTLHTKGFQAERFDRVEDLTKQLPIIPASAKKGEGLAETLLFLAGLSQKYMEKKLTIQVSGPGKGTVLEVKEEKGLGKTIDVILYDGEMKVGSEIVLGGKRGVIRTKIRALLKPKPLNEIRDSKEKFKNVKEVHAASGIKVGAPNLEEALAGSSVLVATNHEEEQKILEELKEIEIEQDSVGPIIRADTLGALEALVKLLGEKEIRPRRAGVGEVTRKDVIEAHSVQEKDPFKGVVFAFNAKVFPEAEEEAKKSGVRIFKENVIYKLLEDYAGWAQETKEKEKQKTLVKVVFPARIRLLPGNVFRNSKPAIIGVKILEGRLKTDCQLMDSNGKKIGKVLGIQSENKQVQEAKKNMEVAISIEGATLGKDIKEGQELLVLLTQDNVSQLEKITEELSEEEKEVLEEIKKIKQKKGVM